MARISIQTVIFFPVKNMITKTTAKLQRLESSFLLAIVLGIALHLAVADAQTASARLAPTSVTHVDSFYPLGNSDKLLFSFYSLEEPQLSEAHKHGVSATGPYYGKKGLIGGVEHAQAAQLPLLYTTGPKVDFESATPATVSAALALLKSEVASASQRPEIGAWALATEELRHWRPGEMQWLEQATRIIHEGDPLNRPVFMYEPNHRDAEALVKTSRYLDFVAKGTYANYARMKDSRTWVRWSVEQAVEAASKTGKIPVAVLWMARDQETAQDIAAIRSWTRHDVYLSLITGAKGIIVWSGFNKRSGFKRDFKDFYEGYLSAAYELNVNPGLGKVFLRGRAVAGISAVVTQGPSSQTYKYQKKSYTYPTVSTKELRLDGRTYLFVVNSANAPCKVRLDGLPNGSSILNAFTNEAATLSNNELSMTAYDVQALTWRDP